MNGASDGTLQHRAETELFHDTLSCELTLPADFVPGHGIGRLSAAETLLRGLAQVEDLRAEDGSDERGDASLHLQRMDAKLDLMLVLLGRLARQHEDILPLRPVRWSRRGIRLELSKHSGALPAAAGLLRLQPSDWLPDHLELPVRVLDEANDAGRFHLWLQFETQPPSMEEAMERHLFRLHRRQIASSRRAR
ncbi:PilZ domain-containing protein [Xanthomonas sp. MUS 060]|uniref:PilZ domain-containing protein n=1 Tax=Xanthomonas sp. MUS 060 TaxID=1588031 RepID=UPI0005F2AE5C|nr:PilZ domain-containing protein [Xanthomonas sp. MUS 060]